MTWPVPGDLHGRGPEACEQQVERRGRGGGRQENLDIILAQFEDDVQKVIKEAQEARDRAIKESEAAYKEWQDESRGGKAGAQYNRTVEERRWPYRLSAGDKILPEQAEDTVPEDGMTLRSAGCGWSSQGLRMSWKTT